MERLSPAQRLQIVQLYYENQRSTRKTLVNRTGSGNFWYEDGVIGDDKHPLYRLYSFILFSVYGFMTVLELMAALFGDFPDDEKSDSVTFAVSHTIVMMKMYSVISRKDLVRTLNKAVVKICEQYEKDDVMEEKYITIKRNLIAYFITVYGAVVVFVLEGLRKVYNRSHFVTVVTYYPTFEDDSVLATCVRVFMTIILMLMMITMIVSVDCFTMMYLIIYKYKIITLRHYFEELRIEFDRVSKSDLETATENLTKGLVDGFVMHNELLRMLKDVDSAFGTVMALQVCQSSGSAVSLLLQIATSDQLTFMAGMKIIFFVVALFFLLGLFLCNAGEITYQATLLGDSIFYCGWHACPVQRPVERKLRKLVLQGCMQAQRPVVMKAFMMLELTYSTFLQVVRTTYSVFALFYAQKN